MGIYCYCKSIGLREIFRQLIYVFAYYFDFQHFSTYVPKSSDILKNLTEFAAKNQADFAILCTERLKFYLINLLDFNHDLFTFCFKIIS